MRRWVAGLAVVGALALAAVVVAVVNAERWIEANRDWIAGRVSEATGRPVSFGEVGIAFLPSLAVRVADLRVGDDPAWSSEPLLTAEAVAVRVAVLPALAGQVVVRRVDLETPVVTIVRRASDSNVDALVDQVGDELRGRRRKTGEARAPGGTLPLAIAAGRVRDGRVRLVDRRGPAERVVEIRQVNGTVAGVVRDRAATIEGSAALLDAPSPNVTLAGTIGPIDLGALDRMPVAAEVRAEGIDVARLRAALPEVAAAMPRPLAIEGPVDATLAVSGTADAPGFDAEIDATRAAVGWAEWFAKPPAVRLVMTSAGRRVGTGAHLEHFALRLADLQAAGRGDASPERVAMNVEAGPAALRSLATLLPALAGARLDGTVAMRVRADGPVTEGRTPALTGTVTLDGVSVRSETPPLDVAGVTQTITLEGDSAVLPSTVMRVGGTPIVVAGRLGRFGAPVVALSDLDVRLFDGRVDGRLEADRREPARPRLAADLRLAGIDVAAAAATRAPAVARTLGGRLAGELALAGRGPGVAALRSSLAGKGRFAVTDGVLRGANLAERVLAGVTRLPGLGTLVPPRLRPKYPAVFGGGDTRFDELTATWRVADQVVHLDRVAMAARDYAIEGRGTLGFDGRLVAQGELVLAPALTEDLLGVTRVLAALRNRSGRIAIPFAVEGTWPRVRVTPDAGRVGGALGGVVGGTLDEVLDGGKAVEKGVNRLLDGILRR